MKKADLVKLISEVMGVSKKEAAQRIADMDVIVEAITKELEVGAKARIGNYIVVEKKVQAARTARNPKTGEVLNIDEKVTVKVKASSTIKNLI